MVAGAKDGNKGFDPVGHGIAQILHSPFSSSGGYRVIFIHMA